MKGSKIIMAMCSLVLSFALVWLAAAAPTVGASFAAMVGCVAFIASSLVLLDSTN